MFKYVKDLDVPFKSGRYVAILKDNNINFMKNVLDKIKIKLVFDNESPITIEKRDSYYYDCDHENKINLNYIINKLGSNLRFCVICADVNSDDIKGFIDNNIVKIVLNYYIDTDIIRINYKEIIDVLIKHKLIGGRVGSFIGPCDNKTLTYVKEYDLRDKKLYGVKLDMILTTDDYPELCDHLISLYKENKNKEAIEDNSNIANISYIIAGYYGNIKFSD